MHITTCDFTIKPKGWAKSEKQLGLGNSLPACRSSLWPP